jgi:hypothetical protein
MAEYICTNFGVCSKYNQVVTESAANPSCSECGSTLNPYSSPPSFWQRNWKQISGGVVSTLLAVIGFFAISSEHILTVNASVNGVITSNDEKKTINCGSVCKAKYSKGIEIILTAQANPNFKFESWKEGCKDSREVDCKITLDADKTAEAVFTPVSPPKPPQPTNPDGLTAPHENESETDVKQNIKHYLSEGMNEVKLAQIDKKNKKLHYSNAIKPFELAIKASNDCARFPELSAVYSNLGSSYLEIGKAGLAFERFQSALDCSPHDGLLQYNFASYYMNQKQEDLALEALEKSLELGVYKKVLDFRQSFCDFIVQDFKKFKEKSELKIVLEKYKVFCK